MLQREVVSDAVSFEQICAADALVAEWLTPVIERFGISLEMFRALAILAATDGCAVGEIARRAGTKPASTSRLVDRLVAENLAYRRGDELDRRRVLLFLSDRGRGLWQDIAAAVAQPPTYAADPLDAAAGRSTDS